jgi:hypothetical protein
MKLTEFYFRSVKLYNKEDTSNEGNEKQSALRGGENRLDRPPPDPLLLARHHPLIRCY